MTRSGRAEKDPELAPDWIAALDNVFADPDQPRLVFQPIVDLSRGVVAGYECLSRFSGPPAAPPDVWFEAAVRAGRAVELELRAVRAALAARDILPDDTFLTINVSPETLASEPLLPMLHACGSLSRVVFEITEHSAVSDYRALSHAVRVMRDAGGRVAVDDAGAGYASLRHILELRPDFVKLDRSLISAVDHDPAMLAVVQMLGDFASRLDSWLIAEGIERVAELDVLASLGVPLGQGYLLGEPGEPWAGLPDPIRARIRERNRTEDGTDVVASLAELRPAVGTDPDRMQAAFDASPGTAHLVQIDDFDRPLGLIRRCDVESARPTLRHTVVVSVSTPIRDAAWRAMQRPEETRFDPLICTLASGRYFGVIPLERLVASLAR